MARKPVDTVQLKLRIRESLRKKLADDAKRRRVSLNKVIGERLEESFQQPSFAASAASLSTSATAIADFVAVPTEATRELRHAAEAVVVAIEQRKHHAIEDAGNRLKQIIDKGKEPPYSLFWRES
jgi:hypothetical protein